MAQQQDPNADPAARGQTGQQGIVAGSQDTYRAKGFTSPTVTPPSNSLSGITAAPTTPAAPETFSWGKYTGPKTPGVLAATSSGGSGQPGTPNKQGPILGAIDALSFANFKPNNSLAQDIGGGLYQGVPITDAMWAQYGYGPGGATLATPAATAPSPFMGALQTGLRSIVGAPAQPSSMIPPNAAVRY